MIHKSILKNEYCCQYINKYKRASDGYGFQQLIP